MSVIMKRILAIVITLTVCIAPFYVYAGEAESELSAAIPNDEQNITWDIQEDSLSEPTLPESANGEREETKEFAGEPMLEDEQAIFIEEDAEPIENENVQEQAVDKEESEARKDNAEPVEQTEHENQKTDLALEYTIEQEDNSEQIAEQELSKDEIDENRMESPEQDIVVQEKIEEEEDDDIELLAFSNGFNYVNGRWGWYQNGKLQTSMTGMAKGTINGTSAWYYIRNGLFTQTTGFTKKISYYTDQKVYYVRSGRFNTSTGMVKGTINGRTAWYYIKSGVYTKSSGLTKKISYYADQKWYYVRNGVFTASTGTTKKITGSDTRSYYVKKGVFNPYSGTANINGKNYTIIKGVVSSLRDQVKDVLLRFNAMESNDRCASLALQPAPSNIVEKYINQKFSVYRFKPNILQIMDCKTIQDVLRQRREYFSESLLFPDSELTNLLIEEKGHVYLAWFPADANSFDLDTLQIESVNKNSITAVCVREFGGEDIKYRLTFIYYNNHLKLSSMYKISELKSKLW